MPDNLRAFVPDPDGAGSYPIVTLSWLLLYQNYPSPERAAALKSFVDWGLTQGQTYSGELGYLSLPAEVAALSQKAVASIQ
jgi:phosphate transport system substrate-binding protein